ncbi:MULTISPECIES: dihydrofolate reductase family protein [Rathayibacter]|uniref:Deaminase n=2 Tax=Rathayibacter festucae TaxID=110937 RepID=A0A3Q9UY21_9MICO|nr:MULTISPECIES: dihydrofolate reductase family protein [Rathayibacter]AZZ51340.1 deaminase [Rathayibacter festucae DSM 15932]MCJ1673125.1 dihydrofolate reductase family protein [Rathayibacter sp. VKM Ac-2929]MCJ1682624.1 dihydrofolate reductase family protein [Rathayibacter sp. VKM Ac-2928]MCJ1699862.1 dihydrofolate reductase family protein [Rathayibacter festucae]QHC63230.1 deaminase [Rathayibacter festucae]
MGALVYSGVASIDGYTVDETGDFSWATPRPEVHRFINETETGVGTYLYGHRIYETMRGWDAGYELAEQFAFIHDFQEMWRAADKVVYSTTLPAVRTRRTRLERTFDPVGVAQEVRSKPHDVSVGGATLGAQALLAGVVDEIRWYVAPIAVGGGTPFLPHGFRSRLELRQQRSFADGTVFLRYGVKR